MNQHPESDNQFPFGTASKAVKRKALWLGAVWLVGGATLMFFINSLLLKKRFAAFNKADIDAPIESISTANHGFAVQLRVKGSIYTFHPITSAGKKIASHFVAIARVGDYVKKEPESDTLYLLKSNASHKILFEHY